MNPNCQISVHDLISNLGIILHSYEYGCRYIELPKGFRIINRILADSIVGTIMFRCANKPASINSGIFPIHEHKIDLIWDDKKSFLVGQDRYELTTIVTYKSSDVYIFYGKQNVKESN